MTEACAYAQGGYIEGQPISHERFQLHPDECLFRAEDVRAGRFRCGRSDHPTPDSTCGIATPADG